MVNERPILTQYRFPQETSESTGGGPDFPGSSGDRERGRFRPSAIPRRTTVAVAGDDGRPLTQTTDQMLAEVLVYQKALLLALSFVAEGVKFSPGEVLNEVRR